MLNLKNAWLVEMHELLLTILCHFEVLSIIGFSSCYELALRSKIEVGRF